ncbi:MAG: LysR substrate-binding domain-containing protein, partial [Pseudomonadota bacterium]
IETFRPNGTLTSNSSEVIREAVVAGVGIALRSTWDIGTDLASGKLVRVLDDYQGTSNIGIFAIYPSRQFLPAKVRLFIDYMAELFGTVPYWERGVTPDVSSLRSQETNGQAAAMNGGHKNRVAFNGSSRSAS